MDAAFKIKIGILNEFTFIIINSQFADMMLLYGLHSYLLYYHFGLIRQSCGWSLGYSNDHIVYRGVKNNRFLEIDFKHSLCNTYIINCLFPQDLMNKEKFDTAHRQMLIILGLIMVIVLLLAIGFKLAIR